MEIEDRVDDVAAAKVLYKELAKTTAEHGDGLSSTALNTALILLVDSFLYATGMPCGEFCQRLIETTRMRENFGTNRGPCCPSGSCKEGHSDSLKCSRWK